MAAAVNTESYSTAVASPVCLGRMIFCRVTSVCGKTFLVSLQKNKIFPKKSCCVNGEVTLKEPPHHNQRCFFGGHLGVYAKWRGLVGWPVGGCGKPQVYCLLCKGPQNFLLLSCTNYHCKGECADYS